VTRQDALEFDVVPPGFRRGSTCEVVGTGRADFDAAARVIEAWAFLPRWVHTVPRHAPQVPGQALVVVAHTFGLRWWLPTRVVETIATDDARGFVYAALPGHIAEGHERFVATFDAATGVVRFDVTAVARLTHPVLRLVPPLFPTVQWWIRRTAMRRMRAAVQRDEAPG
jgi:uncharacterized protein (UPF0548 family)